jgi:hypothetical protein
MIASTNQNISLLAQDELTNTFISIFSIPTCTQESPVMKISLDIIPDDHLSTKDSVTSLCSHKPTKPVFFPNLSESYQIPPRPLGIYSADLWPVGFTSNEWTYIWNSEPLRIEPFLRRTSPADPSYFHATQEDQFKGAPWRLTISAPEKGKNIPMFSHGRVVTYHNCNRINRQYIIDHCAFHDETTAYIRVICFASCREVFDTQSSYPPFILAIPKEFCNAQMHPDLDILPSIDSTSDISQNEPLPTVLSYLSMDQEEQPGLCINIF